MWNQKDGTVCCNQCFCALLSDEKWHFLDAWLKWQYKCRAKVLGKCLGKPLVRTYLTHGDTTHTCTHSRTQIHILWHTIYIYVVVQLRKVCNIFVRKRGRTAKMLKIVPAKSGEENCDGVALVNSQSTTMQQQQHQHQQQQQQQHLWQL